MFLMRVDELDDPVAFLSGARIPLYPPDGIYPPGYKGPIIQRAEWVSDTVLAEIKYGANCSWVKIPTEKSQMAQSLALDMEDPHVARWCNRKIAKATHGALPARLERFGGKTDAPWEGWVCGENYGNGWRRKDGTWTGCGSWSEELQRHVRPDSFDCPELSRVPWDDAHIPEARLVLVRHFYGKRERSP